MGSRFGAIKDVAAHIGRALSGRRTLRDAILRAEAAETRLRGVVEAMPEGVVLLDDEGRYVLWNSRYAEIYHRSADLFEPGVRLMDALRIGVERGDYPEAKGREVAWLEQRRAQLFEPRDRQEQQLSDGSWLMLEDRRLPDGGVVGLRVDITAMKRQARELQSALAAAEAASRAKSEFVANISHEIRTPLHGILGLAQVMERGDLNPDQRHQLGLIRASGDMLLSLLNDLLDLSKIEAGRLELEERIFNVTALVQTACEPFAQLARDKGVSFELHISVEAKGAWLGDPTRFQQVVANLVSNAVKFTEQGSVTVGLEVAAGEFSVVVADTGIGIPADCLSELFQKFVQVEASTSRRFGGSGLGLAISRQLVELMGGSISVTSAPASGSTFLVRIPLRRADTNGAADRRERFAYADRIAILAAEDNPTNQLILKSMLEPIDADITLVANGREAIEAYIAGRFDLVLMDIQMPEVDGVRASTEIRAWELVNNRGRTPILALSANAMAHQVAIYREAGMDDTLSKPFTAQSLYAAIDAQLDARRATPAAA